MKRFSLSKKTASLGQRKRLFIGGVGLIVGLAVVFLTTNFVRALSDTVPLTVTSFSASTLSVNLDAEPVNVTLSGTVTDNLSGFGSLKMYYTSPSGHQVVEAQTVSSTPTSFVATVTFPIHGEAGQWTPAATFSDASGNAQDYTSAQLTSLGFPMVVTASSSNPDTQAPTLSDFQQWNTALDVTITTQIIEGRLTIHDDNSGVASVVMKMISPSGAHVVTLYPEQAYVPQDMYIFADQFPMFSEAGRWLAQVTITDRAGNTRVYDPSDLSTMGFNTGVTITDSMVDNDPPITEALNFSPLENPAHVTATLPGGAVLTAKGKFLDSLSGIRDIYLVFRSQTTGQSTPPDAIVLDTEQPNTEYDFLIATPAYPAEGDWLPELTIVDQVGNTKKYSYADLVAMGIDMKINIGQSVVSTATAGGTVTTDPTNAGTSASQPVQTAVTTPVAGNVSVASMATTASATEFNGYDIVGNQYTISAPTASVESPLVLSFTIDATEVNGMNPNDIVIFRDGQPVEKCLGSAVAVPDPCETAVTQNANGSVTVTVNSSHASQWLLGKKISPTDMFTFKSFKQPIKGGVQLNKQQAGSTVPIKFNIGGNYGQSILRRAPRSQSVDCTSKTPNGDPAVTVAANDGDIKLGGDGYYRYDWKTLKSWSGTCRQFMLDFRTGETAIAYFKF